MCRNLKHLKLKDVNDAYVEPRTGEIIEAREQKANIINEASESEPVNIDQLTAIRDLVKEKHFNDTRLAKALDYFKVDDMTKLSDRQAEEFIMMLEKV